MGIVYTTKNGNEYGVYQGKTVKSDDGLSYKKEDVIYLGRPIDKNDAIFFNREDGIFKFNVENLEKINFSKQLQGKYVANFGKAFDVWNEFSDKLCSTQTIDNIITDESLIEKILTGTEGYRASLSSETNSIRYLDFGATNYLKSFR